MNFPSSALRSLIISPSGNFYGSEQVLYDYLEKTTIAHHVVVNGKGIFRDKLKYLESKHEISEFSEKYLYFFYLKLFFWLLIGKYSRVYWNEAGHINYCLLLAKIFSGRKFIVHIRLLEDANVSRWKMKPGSNISFITISDFIYNSFCYKSNIINDPFSFTNNKLITSEGLKIPIKIGVIGRLTKSKGISFFQEIFELIEYNELADKIRIIFFGDISSDAKNIEWILNPGKYSFINLAGFASDKYEMYNSIDCVLHMNPAEPLGRIFFEALEFNKPLIGLNSGGIGEIAMNIGYSDLIVDFSSKKIAKDVIAKIVTLMNNYDYYKQSFFAHKIAAEKIYSSDSYVKKVDSYFI